MSNSTKSTILDSEGEETRNTLSEESLLSFRVEQALEDALSVESESGGELYQHIDPEGLNRLHRHFNEVDGAFWSLEFSVENHDIIVRADGTVSVQ